MSSMIELKDVTFAYPAEEGKQTKNALDGVTLSIEKGSFVAVLGHNGSGKSTLAKTMNAILVPTGGKVLVEGMDTAQESNLLAIRQRVGMVFQNPDNQIVANVVEEDVAFAPENLGVPSEEIRRRVDDSLRDVGMSEFVRHAPHLLSGGQKQRVAIAGVIAMEPDCIVLDEATAMLDPVGRQEVLSTVHRHMDEAQDADRVLVMDHGKLRMDGTPEAVFAQPEKLWNMGLTVPETVALLYRLRLEGMDLPLTAIHTEDCADAILTALGKAAEKG